MFIQLFKKSWVGKIGHKDNINDINKHDLKSWRLMEFFSDVLFNWNINDITT